MLRNGAIQEVSTLYSHPLLPVRRVGLNGVLGLAYDRDVRELDLLPSGGVWESGVYFSRNDERLTGGRIRIAFVGLRREVVGDCTYDVWEVRDTMELANGTTTDFVKFYAPELGLVLRAINLSRPGERREVAFDRIEALRAQ